MQFAPLPRVTGMYIGNWRLLARLGHGPVTEVFVGQPLDHPDPRELVLIRRFRKGSAARDLKAKLDSAWLASHLNHPNIGAIYEVGREGELWYVVSELIDGQPLDRLLKVAEQRAGRLPLDSTLHIVRSVLSALDHAHDLCDDAGNPLGILHGGIHPHKIFTNYDGEVKLIDFGLAALDDPARKALSHLAPEQAARGGIDRRADIYAVGLILWQCLTGQRLTADDDPAAVLRREPTDELIALLPSERADIGPALLAICGRALAQNPTERYESAGEMRVELEQVLGAASTSRRQLADFLVEHFADERLARAARIAALVAAPASVEHVGLACALGISLEDPPVERVAAPLAEVPSNGAARRFFYKKHVAGLTGMFVAAVVAWWMPERDSQPRETALGALQVAPSPPEIPAETVLRLCGSNTIGEALAPAVAEALLTAKGASALSRSRDARSGHDAIAGTLDGKRIAIAISAEGSATAFSGLANRACDIGMASRPPTPNEIAALREHGYADLRAPGTEHVIALDGIAVIVHPKNPVRELDRLALMAVFTGAITDWSALGGPPGPITVLARDDASGTFDTFKELVLDERQLVAHATRYARSDVLADAVASDPAAIGFVGLPYVRSASVLAIGERGSPALRPSKFTVTTEAYILSRRLYLYTLPQPRSPWILDWVSFALSPSAHEIATKQQFIDLGLVLSAEGCDARCSRRYAATVANARRVSIDLRFRSGSDSLDSRADRDLDRLLGLMQTDPTADLLLLGFSDDSHDERRNVKLSMARATAVADALLQRGVRARVVKGFGSEMSVAPSDTEAHRERNRRVEVWLRRRHDD